MEGKDKGSAEDETRRSKLRRPAPLPPLNSPFPPRIPGAGGAPAAYPEEADGSDEDIIEDDGSAEFYDDDLARQDTSGLLPPPPFVPPPPQALRPPSFVPPPPPPMPMGRPGAVPPMGPPPPFRGGSPFPLRLPPQFAGGPFFPPHAGAAGDAAEDFAEGEFSDGDPAEGDVAQGESSDEYYSDGDLAPPDISEPPPPPQVFATPFPFPPPPPPPPPPPAGGPGFVRPMGPPPPFRGGSPFPSQPSPFAGGAPLPPPLSPRRPAAGRSAGTDNSASQAGGRIPKDSAAPKRARRSYNDIKPSAAAERLREEGEGKAVINGDRENVRRVAIIFLIMVFAIVAIMALGIFGTMGYEYYNKYVERLRAEAERTVEISAPPEDSGKSALKVDANSEEGVCLAAFYGALGDIGKIADMRYTLYTGTVETDGKTRELHCIRKNTGEAFLRLGSDSADGAYLINFFDEPSLRLYDGTLSGRSSPLDSLEETRLRAITAFDEVLFARAFSGLEQAARQPLESAGKEEIDGVVCNVLTAREGRGHSLKFYFDAKDGLLKRLEFKNSSSSARVDFSEYVVSDDSYKYPALRTVYIDGKLFARVRIGFVVSNKWMFFPR